MVVEVVGEEEAAAVGPEVEDFLEEEGVSVAVGLEEVGKMKTADFLNELGKTEITEAIAKSELTTSGEIRVFISHEAVPSPVETAQRRFQELGMTATPERNGVLIFVAPKSQSFAIVGDSAVDAVCGPGFWTGLATEVTGYFQRRDFTGGIILAISTVGKILAQHFPRHKDDRNDLSNEIAHD